MRCPKCKTDIRDDLKFCTGCGFNIQAWINEAGSTAAMKPAAAPKPMPAQKTGTSHHFAAEEQKPGPQPSVAPRKGYISDAFSYPFRGAGLFSMIFIILAFAIARFAFFIGSILAAAFLAIHYFNVIHSTSINPDKELEWPDISDIGEMVSAFFLFFILSLITFGPLNFYLATLLTPEGFNIQPMSVVYAGLLLIWGAVYFPMGSIVIAETYNIASLNPAVVIGCILKAPSKYFLLCFAFGLVFIPSLMADSIGISPFIARVFLFPALYVYTMTVVGRMLGLFSKELLGD